MKLLKYVASTVLVSVLVACGGGGGNAGSSSSSPSTPTTPTTPTIPPEPTLKMGLGGGGSSISASGTSFAQATVFDANGAPILGKLVTFTGDSALIKFSPASGQVLTSAGGVASIQVSPASVSSAGAGTIAAQTTVGTTVLASKFDFQLAAANLGLQSLSLGSGPLPAFGNRAVSVVATINGVASQNTPVQVTFNASCGTATPSVVTTDAAGAASTTYTASAATCAGTNVTVTASAAGAISLSGTIAVAASIATNVQFLSTTPQLIYLKDSVGTTQAQVVFKVVDSSGNPLQNKKLRLSLSNTATGISLDTVGNTSPVDLTTDSLGIVTAAVFSGTVPTSVNVQATLLDSNGLTTSLSSSSNLLTVASGRPTQRSLSLAASKLSIEGLNFDGETTSLTLSMADRQGNPVPPGTQVNFVSESGVLLPAVCFVPPVTPATASSPAIPTSACTVTLRTQGTRPVNGRVSILAYVAGEEDFVDANGNNVYDPGELFADLGRAYRDDNSKATVPASFNGLPISVTNGQYDAGEFQQPRAGTNACVPGVGCAGDGVWGAADVRQQATVVFATGTAQIVGSATPSSIALVISDTNPNNTNSMPTGSIVSATAVDRTSTNGLTCAIAGDSSVKILNTLEATFTAFGFKECVPGDAVAIKVTTPLGTSTSITFPIQ